MIDSLLIRIFAYAIVFFIVIFVVISDLNRCVIGHELLSNKNTYSFECIKGLSSLKILGTIILIVATFTLIKLIYKKINK